MHVYESNPKPIGPVRKKVPRSAFVDAVGCAYLMGFLNPIEGYSGFRFMGWESPASEVRDALREYLVATKSPKS